MLDYLLDIFYKFLNVSIHLIVNSGEKLSVVQRPSTLGLLGALIALRISRRD